MKSVSTEFLGDLHPAVSSEPLWSFPSLKHIFFFQSILSLVCFILGTGRATQYRSPEMMGDPIRWWTRQMPTLARDGTRLKLGFRNTVQVSLRVTGIQIPEPSPLPPKVSCGWKPESGAGHSRLWGYSVLTTRLDF